MVFNYTTYELDVKAGCGQIKSGKDGLNKQDHGQYWAEENAEQQTAALARIQDFNIGLLP
jgi:hypothetical protein